MNYRLMPFDDCNLKGMPHPSRMSSENFQENLNSLRKELLPAFLSCTFSSGIPGAFSARPMLWESVRRWVAKRNDTEIGRVGLAGSAQMGYSLSPNKKWSQFGPKSDLDFFIVDENVFRRISADATAFIDGCERVRGDDIARQLKRGFLNSFFIPSSIEKYPFAQHINNDGSILVQRLAATGFPIEKVTFRIYKNWLCYEQQILINIKALRDKGSALATPTHLAVDFL